jgi:hypothetical protein
MGKNNQLGQDSQDLKIMFNVDTMLFERRQCIVSPAERSITIIILRECRGKCHHI